MTRGGSASRMARDATAHALGGDDLAKLAALRGALRDATPPTASDATTAAVDDAKDESSARAAYQTRVRAHRANRRGKTVTVAGPVSPGDADALARALKRALGVGGAVDDDAPGVDGSAIVLQGDVVDDVVRCLRERGYASARRG